MTWLKNAIGWGIVIYALMYLVWSGLVIYGLSLGILSLIVRLGVLVLATTIAGRSLKVGSWKDLVPYTFVWAVIAALLDALFLVPFSGWGLYASWSVWVGYALVVIIPLLTSLRRKVSAAPRLA
ncbi:hypothetical protein A3A38_03145 [Candidatus Kaiserbacteria bacterium RIFCSPLOWO2_01_FULL_53_17]|uniref:Uncharacterized protein n=1 Tax=Candidatus Kaiserbacteria bacterium RIFCSPLOWO2_01_FULL_53_17 TaxID=1798511 RepID=A0A1F6EGM4_9BACT|nr:MAG: hypothetical protein A3A38_03145 [Candidatus Kaiserbacteria bacterium RIFCSPLOWO2_01_FULL_53_17]